MDAYAARLPVSPVALPPLENPKVIWSSERAAGHEFVFEDDGTRFVNTHCRRCGGSPGDFYLSAGRFSPCEA